jgi:hypothetical protein
VEAIVSAPLERQQAEFAAALLDAAPDGPALSEAAPIGAAVISAAVSGEETTPRLDRLLADPASADERLRLYRGGIAASRRRALANAYPVVRALVGEEYFAGLADAYDREYPSASGDLNLFGASLATFVGGIPSAASLPYLADVATLEWAVHRAYFAADATPLPGERLAMLTPEALLARRFALHPACTWMTSAFPVVTIWQAHQPDSVVALPVEMRRAETALVVRPRWQAQVRLASGAEVAVLAALRDGARLETAISAGLASGEAFDFGGALVRWLDAGILVG